MSDESSQMEIEPETCQACGWVRRRLDEPDGCLGTLPGFWAACCGHGDPSGAYVAFENGVALRGFTRIEADGSRPANPQWVRRTQAEE
jgi:hypothetical protein